jgi:hypothetical protein
LVGKVLLIHKALVDRDTPSHGSSTPTDTPHSDGGIVLNEADYQATDDALPEIDCREHADVPFQGLLLMAHALFGRFCQKQHSFSIREQPMSRFCQAHRVRIAAQ